MLINDDFDYIRWYCGWLLVTSLHETLCVKFESHRPGRCESFKAQSLTKFFGFRKSHICKGLSVNIHKLLKSRLFVWRTQPGVINWKQRPSESSPSSVIQHHPILLVLRAGHIELPNLNVFVRVILVVRCSNRHPSRDTLGSAESLDRKASFLKFDSGLLHVQLLRLDL